MLLLVGAVVFATPGFGQAAGHGGGFHGGGGHFGGGAHFGGGFGAYHGGFNHGGYGSGFGYHSYYGYHPSYGYDNYYGYYPYYNTYPSSSYDTYPYVESSPTYDSGYAGSYGDVGSSTPPAVNYQSFYPPATATTESDNGAHVTVTVPAGAQLWFDGTPTTSTGSVREFNSPPLTPGHRYSYEVQARWNENGKEVTQTQKVQVGAGTHAQVDFPVPAKAVGQTAAAPKP
jgi:uncharacterized protein (TIGR03000 family)